jgi:serine/threonine protein kinase
MPVTLTSLGSISKQNFRVRMEEYGEEAEEEGEHEPVFPAELLPGIAVGARLGAGAFGCVFSAVLSSSGSACAVKYTHARSSPELQFALREREVLAELQQCAQVVRLLDSAVRGQEVALALELLPAPLLAHLAGATGYSEQQAKEILRDVAAAVRYMHAHLIAHLDLKVWVVSCLFHF